MFGYVNVLAEELKIKEYNIFKAYYCGLCKRHGALTGQPSRLALSYDFTVLALLLDSMQENAAEIVSGRCALHPAKKRPVARASDMLDYCAYMSVALTYFKVKDDIADHALSKYSFALPLFVLPAKKAKKLYSETTKTIESYLAELSVLEKENCRNIDLPAAVFGKLMAVLFNHESVASPALEHMGYALGRWLYIIDAIDDFEKDKSKGAYNPFTCREDIENSLPSLWYNLGEVAKAYELVDLKRNKPLIDNIVYYGIKNSTLSALERAGINRR